jgi:hypothetical protein
MLFLDAPEDFIEKLSLVFEKFRKYSFFEVSCSDFSLPKSRLISNHLMTVRCSECCFKLFL